MLRFGLARGAAPGALFHRILGYTVRAEFSLTGDVTNIGQSIRHKEREASPEGEREMRPARPELLPSAFPDPSPPTMLLARGQENGQKLRAGGYREIRDGSKEEGNLKTGKKKMGIEESGFKEEKSGSAAGSTRDVCGRYFRPQAWVQGGERHGSARWNSWCLATKDEAPDA